MADRHDTPAAGDEERDRPGAPAPARRGSRRRLALLAASALAVQLLVLYLPGSPDRSLELPWFPGADKLVHAAVFAAATYLFGRLSGRVGLVASLFAVHAVVSELLQWRFLPYRDGDIADAVADLIGIAVAVWLLRRRSPARPER